MEYHNNKFLGFTLPEVLITIVIIGVVAAMTLSPLITKIRNKGYVERLIKTYSVLQDVTNQIVEENGTPSNWSWSYPNSNPTNNYLKIVEYYKKKLKYVHYCKNIGADKIVSASDYKYLNGETSVYYGDVHAQAPASTHRALFSNDYMFVLNDGIIVSLGFQQYADGGFAWGAPDLLFTIDVNGKKGPNVIGRDTFFLYLTKNGNGKILPYVSNEASFNWSNPYKDTCKTNLQGYSCAYRIITEGGMNY